MKSLVIFAFVLVSVACGSRLTKEQIVEYGEIGYSDIVSFIVQGYQCHWNGMSPEDLNLSPVYSYSSEYAGFAKKDIDGDGLDELLIGDSFEDGTYMLYDIYCFNKKDASLVHLASGGERDRFVVSTDGTVVEEGSNSASDSFTKGYRIRKGKLVEMRRQPRQESLMALEFEKFSDLAKSGLLCGGYTEQRAPSEEEIAMFRETMGTGENVFSPVSVSTQVVSGINYKFRCHYQDDDRNGYCLVTIYKPLPGRGEPQVTLIEQE